MTNTVNFKFDGEFSQYQTLKHCQKPKEINLCSHLKLNASERRHEAYSKAIKEYDRDCEIALSIITSLLGPDPLSRVQFIIDDDHRSDR